MMCETGMSNAMENIQLLATKAWIVSESPLWEMIHTTCTRYCCELLLEKAYTTSIYKLLGQAIINVHHSENGPPEQCALGFHFVAMVVELLVVSAWRGRIGILEISR